MAALIGHTPHPTSVNTTSACVSSICVCVDDVGMNTGVCDAALELIRMDRVHAVGCMTGGAAWAASAPRLRALDMTRTDVGLHLDLTEFPLTLRPRPLSALIASSYSRRLNRSAVRTEVRAQLDRFEQAMGRAPAFVDGHQHVHQLPIVRDALLQEIASRYRRSPPWIRSTRHFKRPTAFLEHGWGHALKPWIIELLGASALSLGARQAEIGQNRRLLGVYDFKGGAPRYRRLLQEWLEAAETADLLMCHPSLTSDPRDALAHSRRQEYDVLASSEFGAWIVGADIALRPMSHILAATATPDISRIGPLAANSLPPE